MNTSKPTRWRWFALSALFVPQAIQAQMTQDILGYWSFDGALTDGTANGGDGSFVVQGALDAPLTPNFGTGQFGQGVDLEGDDNQMVVIDGAGNANFMGESLYDSAATQQITVSTWIRVEDGDFTKAWQAIVAKGEGNSWRLARNGQTQTVAYNGGLGNVSPSSTILLNDNQFHHVVGVTDATGISLYVDGQLQGRQAGTTNLADSAQNLTIGANPVNDNRSFDGIIDDVIISARPLSPFEVSVLYNGGTGVTGQQLLDATDSNTNGLPDFWETATGQTNPTADPDSDNLSNLQEYNLGTDPADNDTDNDGLVDGSEAANNGNPFVADTDGDGLNDGDEITNMTLVNNPDSDGDTFTDFDEVQAGSNPNDDESIPNPFVSGLVSYWKFDGDLNDSRTTGANGTFRTTGDNGSKAPAFVTGKFGQSVNLVGEDNDYIEIDSVPEDTFDFAEGDLTVSAWVRVAAFTEGWQALIAKGEGASWRIARQGNSDNLAFNPGNWKDQGDDIIANGVDLDNNMFRHIVATVDADGVGELWVDGVRLAVTDSQVGSPTIVGNSLNLLIGGNPTTAIAANPTARSWNGEIDDLAIWSRPLTAGQISTIYNNGDGTTIDALINDMDQDDDGLPNLFETRNGLNPMDPSDASEDPDMDGLTNLQEFNGTFPEFMDPDSIDPVTTFVGNFRGGTNIRNADSDGDGLSDGREVLGADLSTGVNFNDRTTFNLLTDPLNPDSDGDGLTDGTGEMAAGTDPALEDTDSDGFSDGDEVNLGTIPTDANSVPNLATGILGYWPFDGDYNDGTGLGNTGTPQTLGTGAVSFDTGLFGQAIRVNNREGTYVEIDGGANGTAPSDFIQAGGNISFSLWATAEDLNTSWQSLIATGEGNAWRLQRHRDQTNLALAGGGVESAGGPDLTTGEFFHIAGVIRNGKNLTLYVDGAQVAQSTTGPTIGRGFEMAANLLRIGGNSQATALVETLDDMDGDTMVYRTWSGRIDDVAVWSRPLTALEVSNIADGRFNNQALLALEPRIANATGGGGATTGGPALSLGTVQPGMPLAVSATGLDPARTYELRRSTNLVTFTPVAGTQTTGMATATLTDPSAPTGNAFYAIFEVTP